MPSRNALNGAQVIVDYLIQEKVPQVFGLCGHGNIQFIDALYERSADIKTISVHHESVAGFMADVYYRVSGRPTWLGEPADLARQRVSRFGAVHGGDRQCADQPVQPRRIPGALSALSG
jgi:Thiamine pyrophosphate enzyme, N-terminal TPP binding domain